MSCRMAEGSIAQKIEAWGHHVSLYYEQVLVVTSVMDASRRLMPFLANMQLRFATSEAWRRQPAAWDLQMRACRPE